MEKQQLVIEDLAFAWPNGKGFSNVHLTMQNGDFFLIHGASGIGKSTLLRLLVRLEIPTQGRILLQGEDIVTMPPNILRQRIALVSQTPQLAVTTLDKALRLPFRFAVNAHLKEPSEEDIRTCLEMVRLADIPLTSDTGALSLGQQQRAALVRHILLKPELLLLDEPTSALDAESRLDVEHCIEKLNESGTSILMITHTEYVPDRPYRTWHLAWHLDQGSLTEKTA